MKKFLLSTIIALLAITLGFYGQERDTAQGGKKVKLQLIYQLDSTKLNLGGKLISEIKDALKKKGRDIPQEDIDWVLNKIRLDIVRERKILYTNDGKEIEIPYFCYIPHSANYKYFILNICDYSNGTAKNQQTKLIKIDDGSIIWEIKDKMMAYAAISNDGSVTVEQQRPILSEGIICPKIDFYNNNGKLIKTIDGLISLPMQYTISNDGNIFVSVTRDNKACYCNGYDKFGNELWKTQVPCGHYDDERITFLNNNRYFLYSCFPNSAHTLVIDNNGNVVVHYDFIIRNGTFTDDGKYLIFNATQDSIHYLNTQNGEVIHEKIANGVRGNTDYYFVNLFDKSGAEGTIMLNKSGIIQGVYLEQGEVSPNKHVITTPMGIQLLEVETEK